MLAGGTGALVGALTSIGIPKDSVLRYETALKADKFLVVVHGDAQDTRRAHEVLGGADLASFDHHSVSEPTSAATSSPTQAAQTSPAYGGRPWVSLCSWDGEARVAGERRPP